MAWRKLEDTFYDSPKIKRLAKLLAIERPHAAGCVALLWSWALRHAKDGDLSKYDIEDIEDAAFWTGARGDFTQSCKTVGLIDGENGSFAIHNWIERGGSFAEAQRKRLKAKAKNSRPGNSRKIQENPGTSRKIRLRGEENRGEENIDHICIESGADAPAAIRSDFSKKANQDVGPLEGRLAQQRKHIQEVWTHYRTHHPGTALQLKANRKEYRLIRERLEDFDLDTLKRSIDGYHRSAFHTGQNEHGKRYLGLDLIMRDISHVQAGLDFVNTKQTDPQRPQLLDPDLPIGDRGQRTN